MLENLNPFKQSTQDPSTVGRIYCNLKQLMDLKWAVQSVKLPKSQKINRPQTGSHISRFRGRGMEFSEVRVYQAGDDVRSIDWRVTARRQTPHTKLFNEERERPLLILCDQSQSQFFGSQHSFKSVKAAEATALFAWSALQHNDRVGGIVFSDHGHHEIKPARNSKNVMRLLKLVTDFNHALKIDNPKPANKFSLDDALTECIRLSKPGTLVVIISDFHTANLHTEKLLSKLNKHSDLIFVHTFDPIEMTLPPTGIYPISDGDETLVIDTSDDRLNKRFLSFIKNRESTLSHLSAKFKAPLINLSTANSTTESLFSLLFSLKR